MQRIFTLLIQDDISVVTRILTIVSSRGYKMESFFLGKALNTEQSTITMVLSITPAIAEQLIKQLLKLVQVSEVKDVTDKPCVERELMFIKVMSTTATRSAILDIVKIYEAKVSNITINSITIEATGKPSKISALQESLKRYFIVEIVRTGKIALERDFDKDYEPERMLN